MHGGITMGMLLSKYQIPQFKEDWFELSTEQMVDKYKESRYNIYEKAKQLGLPKRPNFWWPRSKEEKFKSLYGITQVQDMLEIFQISRTAYDSKVKQLGLKKSCKI